MIGQSLMQMIKDKRRQMFADESPEDLDMSSEPAEFDQPDAAHGFTIGLRHKRRTAILKNMLNEAGYGDLAKMINIKEQ